jgi:spoIIIJ-associated protein
MASTPAAEALTEMLERLVEALGLEAQVSVADDGETVAGTLEGEDLGLFIGRHGTTIDAVQHLAMRVVAGAAGERRRVEIDAEGYRERRAEALRGQADEAAGDALRFGRAVSLDAMGATERKLVHEYLRDRGDVETYSEGDEPNRHLVVAPLSD